MEQNWNQYFFNLIKKHFDKPWDFYYLSCNPNISWDIVAANPDKHLNWDIVEANPSKPWNFYYLSCNPNITMDIVEANLDKPWDWDHLSCNPNITWNIVKANPDKDWNWFKIRHNTFQKEKEMFELRVKKQKFIQENIFEELVKIAMHPKKIEKYLNMGYSIDELDYLL